MTRHRLREDTELNSMQKKLVGNITHQLKTPLAIISSQVALEKNGARWEPQSSWSM